MNAKIGCELVGYGPAILPELYTMHEQISGENVAQILQACPKVKGGTLVKDLQALAAMAGTCDIKPLRHLAIFGMLVAGDLWDVYDISGWTSLATLNIKTNNQRVSVMYMQGTANQWRAELTGYCCSPLFQVQATLQFFKHNLNEFMELKQPTANDVKGLIA